MTEVLTARDGAVLTNTLNRPHAYNAFNRALHDAPAAGVLVQAVHQLHGIQNSPAAHPYTAEIEG